MPQMVECIITFPSITFFSTLYHQLFSEKHDAVSVQTRKIALSMRDAFSSAEFSIIISLQIFQTSYNIEYSVFQKF